MVGAGGLDRDAADIAAMMGRYTKIAFLDDDPTPEKQQRYNIVGSIHNLDKFVGQYGDCIATVGKISFFKLYKFRSMKMSAPHDMPTHMLENPGQLVCVY